jgi:hypothetical protein
VDRDEFLDACRDLCDTLFGGLVGQLDPTAERVIERTPVHARHLDLIADIYPDSRVVHIIRDGWDVARSLIAQPWGPETMTAAAEEWRTSIESARASRKPEHYEEVRYEALLSDPELRLRELVEQLGLECPDSVLQSMVAEARAHYNVDPKMPTVGGGKWKQLPAKQIREFDRIAGELNAELGYEPSGIRGRPKLRLGGRLRSAPSSIAGRVRGRRASSQAEVVAEAERNQLATQRFLETIHSRDARRLREMLSPNAEVRVSRGDERWTERGAAAADRLLDWIERDVAWGGRQLRSEFHVGVPLCLALIAYADGKGAAATRLFVVHVADDAVVRLSVYAPPFP